MTTCPGDETVPNRCTCTCPGCSYHCAAHQEIPMTDEETDCTHEKTVNKFSGLTICDNCGKGLGHWSVPAPRLNALQHPDGTFEIA